MPDPDRTTAHASPADPADTGSADQVADHLLLLAGVGVPPSPSPTAGPAAPAVPGYEILGELGRGGMGVVYRARQLGANRDVALKVVLAGGHAGPEAVARFRAEAEAVARLQHPNVVAVFEVGEHAGLPYYSMELCPGGALNAAPGPTDPRVAAGTVLKLARGVAAAHAAGVVHRDLKPGNVLLAADGEPKVADFGLARRLDAGGDAGLTRTGAVVGTPSYMPPEQAVGARAVGPPADVYSLGAILYERLTGRPPFRGPTAADTVLMVVTEDPVPPRAVDPAVPRDLEAVVLRCLDKDPAHRYPTAAALADDLRRFLDGDPVSAARTGLAGRVAGALDRVRLRAEFAAYGSLLLALAPVMLLPEVWVTAVVRNGWPGHLLSVGQFGRVAGFLACVAYFRGWDLRPRGPAERQLWCVWGGYVLACVAVGLSWRAAFNLWSTSLEAHFYLPLSCLTALAFFALAANFWGYCTVVGAGFLLLPFAMAADLSLAPLEFGAAWAAVLVVIGTRLRRLGRAAPGSSPAAGGPAAAAPPTAEYRP